MCYDLSIFLDSLFPGKSDVYEGGGFNHGARELSSQSGGGPSIISSGADGSGLDGGESTFTPPVVEGSSPVAAWFADVTVGMFELVVVCGWFWGVLSFAVLWRSESIQTEFIFVFQKTPLNLAD